MPASGEVTGRRPREDGASFRVTATSRPWRPWILPSLCWLVGVAACTVLVSWAWGETAQLAHRNLLLSDLFLAVENAQVDLQHGGLTHLYAGQGSLEVALPGFQLALVALLRLVDALGAPAYIGFTLKGGRFANFAVGGSWAFLLFAVYGLALSAVFPVVACLRRCGVHGVTLALAAVATTGALGYSAVLWGHPEVGLATGLLVGAALWCLDGRWKGAAWLLGAAVATQPLVLLGLPLLLGLAGVRRWLPMAWRIILPGLVSVLLPLFGDPGDTFRQVVLQPTYPTSTGYNLLTPWLAVVPSHGPDTVDAGWPRTVALVLAIGIAYVMVRRMNRYAGAVPDVVIWTLGLSLAVRCLFEAVFYTYYAVPAVVLLLVAASARGAWRALGVIVVATAFFVFPFEVRHADHVENLALVAVAMVAMVALSAPWSWLQAARRSSPAPQVAAAPVGLP
jgi:hypothetical protein